MKEEPYLAPSIFPEEKKHDDYIPYENEGIEIPEVKLNIPDLEQTRAEEEMARIAARLAEPSPSHSSVSGDGITDKATVPEGEPSGVNYWYVALAILAFIGNLIFFLPLCLLGLFGLSKHPFIGYFMFRDMFRK